MKDTDWFLALIAYVLSIIALVTGSGNAPTSVVLPLLVIHYGLPIYLLSRLLLDHIVPYALGETRRDGRDDSHADRT